MKTNLSILFLILLFISSQAQTNNSIDIVVGIDRTYRNVNTTENSELAEMLLSTTEGETAKFNWRLGVNYRKGLSETTYLKIGARLSSLGYSWGVEGLRWGSQHDGMGGFNPDLDPDAPSSVMFTTDYLFFELPVSFGLIKKKDKFSFFAEVGVSPNIYLTTKTKQVLDGDDTSTDLTKAPHIRAVHLSTLAAVGVVYHINENISIFGQPSFRYHFTTLDKGAVLKEFLYSYGVELGLRKNL